VEKGCLSAFFITHFSFFSGTIPAMSSPAVDMLSARRLLPSGRAIYATVLRYGVHQKDYCAYLRETDPKRLCVLAALAGLSALKRPCQVELALAEPVDLAAIHSLFPDLSPRLTPLLKKHRIVCREMTPQEAGACEEKIRQTIAIAERMNALFPPPSDEAAADDSETFHSTTLPAADQLTLL